MQLCGRRVILTDETTVSRYNVVSILNKAMSTHVGNRSEIDYLWKYYTGIQPILNRIKEVRPEICNKIRVNRASEIVSFATGYLMGEPVQYVSRGNEDVTDDINTLNEYMFAEEKSAKDKELADWFHVCGTAFRLALPDKGEEDESPFETYTLDPRSTFVVYSNDHRQIPVLGVHYVTDDEGHTKYSCYSADKYFEVHEDKVVTEELHILGGIPIIEYPLNIARIGRIEIVIDLLDAINTCESNRLDGVEQLVQSLMLFHNVDISSEEFRQLREEGALRYKDIDPQMKADISYLINSIDQVSTQTLVDDLYQTVLTICGMPNRNGRESSTSDTGRATELRDGWASAECQAKNAEMMFKRSEKQFLKIILNICKKSQGNDLYESDLSIKNIEIRFTRRNYENIVSKSQVLTTMLANEKIHPRLAFEHCGLFVDSDLAYQLSEQYVAEHPKEVIPNEPSEPVEVD